MVSMTSDFGLPEDTWRMPGDIFGFHNLIGVWGRAGVAAGF